MYLGGSAFGDAQLAPSVPAAALPPLAPAFRPAVLVMPAGRRTPQGSGPARVPHTPCPHQPACPPNPATARRPWSLVPGRTRKAALLQQAADVRHEALDQRQRRVLSNRGAVAWGGSVDKVGLHPALQLRRQPMSRRRSCPGHPGRSGHRLPASRPQSIAANPRCQPALCHAPRRAAARWSGSCPGHRAARILQGAGKEEGWRMHQGMQKEERGALPRHSVGRCGQLHGTRTAQQQCRK